MESENTVSELDEIQENMIEDNGEYWAGRVESVLLETDQKVDEVSALETLAILDAEHGITDHYDADETDLFLDEFQEAIVELDAKDDVMDEHIKDAKKGDNTEDDTEEANDDISE